MVIFIRCEKLFCLSCFLFALGGYVSSMALVKDKNKVFSCGLSVAPVTSWLLYGNQFCYLYNY